jgi:hypothetical protein
MTNIIPRAIADLTTQLSTAVGVGATSFSISSNVDDDGNTLPAGLYCFTIDSGTSNKEYLIGQLNGSDVTSVRRVSRQGVETSGAGKAHRVGAPCVITNFASLQRVVDILRGVLTLDGASPVRYDAEPTLSDPEELATVGYVLSVVTGGAVSFDKQTIAGTAGESIVAGDLIYLNESDQEWYKCDADTAATVEGVMRGIALGTGSDGVAITGGVHLAGAWTTSGLTAGSIYYASNTAGALATSAGTTRHIVGVALSTTRLFVIPQTRETIPTRTRDALSGGGALGIPSTSNKFTTQEFISTANPATVQVFTASGTWTKPAGLKYAIVEVVGGGQGGGGQSQEAGNAGGTTSFGSIISATGGDSGVGGVGSSGDINVGGGDGAIQPHGTGSGAVGGSGGSSVLGGGGRGTSGSTAGLNGKNYGGGGGGGGSSSSGAIGGGGGGAGGYSRKLVLASALGSTETVTIGAGGTGTTNSGRTGGNGAPGVCIVTEYYS